MDNKDGACYICGEPISSYITYCTEHYLLKEAAYGVNDLEKNNEEFRERAIERLLEYVKYMMGKQHYQYPLHWGPQNWWKHEMDLMGFKIDE